MKKIIFLFLTIFLITGCSSEIIYRFEEDKIISDINIIFNEKEYELYTDQYTDNHGHLASGEENTQDSIKNVYESLSLVAIQGEKIKYYDATGIKENDGSYTYQYNYEFDYNDFKNNHYLNGCFQYYLNYEDDNYYHYKISGSATCDDVDSFTLKVKSDTKVIDSNSEKIEDGTHTWKISKENNDISFSISKKNKSEVNKKSYTMQIIGFILLVILISITFFYYKKSKEID